MRVFSVRCSVFGKNKDSKILFLLNTEHRTLNILNAGEYHALDLA